MRNSLSVFACMALILGTPAYAGPVSPSQLRDTHKPCSKIESYLLTVTFRSDGWSDTDKGSEWFQGRIEKIKDLSKKAGIQSLSMEADSYSVYFSKHETKPIYQYGGTVSLIVPIADKSIIDLLQKQRYLVEIADQCAADKSQPVEMPFN